MDNDLKKNYMQALFRFKKCGLDFQRMPDVNMTELFVMAGLSNNIYGVDQCVSLSKIQGHAHITKAAISQMFTSLEKRGYVIRETDPSNRRRITVTLTTEGEEILKQAQAQADRMLNEILCRFGEENAWQLISLLTQLSDITEGLKLENTAEKQKGDSQHAQA